MEREGEVEREDKEVGKGGREIGREGGREREGGRGREGEVEKEGGREG